MKANNKNKNNKYKIILAGVTIVLVALIYMFTIKKNPDAISSESMDIKFNKQAELTFVSGTNNEVISEIDIEVANNNQLRARGLMYRNSLPENAGMLFIFEYEDIQGFWMKNTYIALDILFVNGNKEIVTIHANTTPLKEWNYASTEPALYVVEVNAGYCLKHNIKEGDKIDFNIN